MCVACVWDHSGGFSGVVYGKSSRVLGGSLGKSPLELFPYTTPEKPPE